MNKTEVATVLAKLGAAYRLAVEPDQLSVWNDALEKYSAEHVVEAMKLWVETQPRFPNPSQLIEASAAVARRHAVENAEKRGLAEQHDEPQLPLPRRNELAKLGVAECRAALAAARKKSPTKEPTEEET